MSHLRLGLPKGILLSGFPTKTLYAFLNFSIRATCPARLSRLILQPFRHFTYVTSHSPTLPSLYLRHSSFSNPSVVSPTSQFILQPIFRFSYITNSSYVTWRTAHVSITSRGRVEIRRRHIPYCLGYTFHFVNHEKESLPYKLLLL